MRERCRLLRHGWHVAQRQLQDAGPDGGVSRGGGGDAQGGQGLERGPVPEEVIARPQRPRPAGFGPPAQLRQGRRAREGGALLGGTWGG